jgi:FkbM family methyltransferase
MLCAGTFVDVGANVGDTLTSWYNDPSCAVAPRELRPIGVKCDWRWPWWLPLNVRRRWCAEAFEANPKFTTRLLRTAERLEKRHGIRVNVHAQTALSVRDGNATFGLDTLHGTGSSLQLHRHALDAQNRKNAGARVGDNTTTVRTVDATPFLDAVGGRGGPIALKLDVEGSEYDILRDLLMSGVLCKRVETLWVEFHSTRDGAVGTPARVDEVFKWMLETHNENARALQQAWLPYTSARCSTTLLQWS